RDPVAAFQSLRGPGGDQRAAAPGPVRRLPQQVIGGTGAEAEAAVDALVQDPGDRGGVGVSRGAHTHSPISARTSGAILAVNSEHDTGDGSSFSGFISRSGSKAVFTAFITSRVSGLNSHSR